MGEVGIGPDGESRDRHADDQGERAQARDEWARDRMAAARVARLATVGDDGRPHLVPVTFALEGERIVTAVDHKPKSGAWLRRLRNIQVNPNVCVLVDHYDEDWTALWWVRADGFATILDGEDERAPALLAPLVAKYPQYRPQPPTGPLIVVQVTHYSTWSALPTSPT
ncbi:TIGR03668 family PPOX class F420-dependent oxidoreductase [Sphaerisporangium melleum]|uniref:TIGR03668 family PPOX class F420-dependent oxidoreductase n=1 Tax=Sphaerisporangium melleum TaxID=321316 RepID=UPI00227B49A0|nr:TIGR03668 family PPOX class F420-dependent oxidoreductase [Sphaerisporangium melleum]